MSANAIDLFAGVNVPPPTAVNQVLVATGANAAAWTGPPLNLQSTGTLPVFGSGTTGDSFNRTEIRANGNIAMGTGGISPGNIISFNGTALQANSAGGFKVAAGSLDVGAAGSGLAVAEGSGTNAKQGVFTLSGAATTVVTNTTVTANSRIIMTTQTLGTVAAASTLAVTARSAGASFTVTPSQATDTSVIAFQIFEPG